MESFLYEAQPERVVFGSGKIKEAAEEICEWGVSRVLIVCTKGRFEAAEVIQEQLGGKSAGIHASAEQHVPEQNVSEILRVIQQSGADAIIAIGGGSAVGLAKAAALDTHLPILAVPTTYSGSEMTSVWGITYREGKRTGRNPVVKPKTVIYDPELTLTMPSYLSLTSGINSMAHCFEALYASKRNPVTSIMAEEGIRALFHSLQKITAVPGDREARSNALYGSWLAGEALNMADMGLHHKLCHALGGNAGLPHADTHTVILPYVIAYNAAGIPETMARAATALGLKQGEVPEQLFRLIESGNGPGSLAELGMKEKHIEAAAEEVIQQSFMNPCPVTKKDLTRLLKQAWEGKREL
ncbi:maleylacetate reductase [Salibacterium sp. K-3]